MTFVTRKIRGWLTNSRIQRDTVEFGRGSRRSNSDYPGLRIVRVRDSTNHEAPEWFSQKQEQVGFTRGVFQMGERLFFRVYRNPRSFPMVRTLSKISRWGDGAAPKPQEYYWNPGLYELTVASLQPNDAESMQWAAQAHELREAAMNFGDATALPLPLHLAKQMEEYVVRLDVPDESVSED